MSKKTKTEPMQREKKVKRIKTHHAVGVTAINVDCFDVEEEESSKLVQGNCYSQFREISQKLRKIFHAVYLAKQKKKTENLQNCISDVCILIMKMKKLNRLDKHCSKRSRDAVAEGKQKVDNLNLQYQNLLYEVTHLQKEVTKCLEFRSQDEDIELIPIEEFYEEAPASISRPEVTKLDTHELTMARLEWELHQRKQLAVMLRKSEVKKEDCKESIRKVKECLSNIQPTLQSILDSTEPLQSKLGMPLQATRVKHAIAKFLPKPLYSLYIELCAYKEACDKHMSISVEGNVDNAKVLELNIEDVIEDSGESDQEENFNVKRHRHSVSIRPNESHKDILSKHPLSVSLTLKCDGAKLLIEFYYLFHLNIVTTYIKNLMLADVISGNFHNDLLNASSLLESLFPGDDGKTSPNPINKYLLQKIQYEETPFSHEKTGWPYLWSQHMSGLHFLSIDLSDQITTNGVSASYMENVIAAIKARIGARIALTKQILQLEKGTKVPSDLSHIYPPTIVSQLKKWTPASWDDVMKHPQYDELIELGVISKDSTVFRGVIERGSATLTSLVVVPPNYPNKTSVFLLYLQWKITSTAATSCALRELEEEINIRCVENLPPSHSNELLMCQMHHLLCCFDIFLETEHSEESLVGPCEFLREKVLTRIYRGRSHSRPYKYLPFKNIFTH